MEILRLSAFIYATVRTFFDSLSTTTAGMRPFSSNFSSSIETKLVSGMGILLL